MYPKIYYIFKSGDLESIKKIFKKKNVNIDAADVNTTTALHIASKAGNDEIVGFLLESGADVTKKDYKRRNALECAIEKDKR